MRLFIWLYLVSQAQTNLVISGTVEDPSGARFLGAEVELLRDGTQMRTTTTDASGAFRFDRLQPGSYEVRTHKEGFKSDTTKVTLGTRRSEEHTSELQSQSNLVCRLLLEKKKNKKKNKA